MYTAISSWAKQGPGHVRLATHGDLWSARWRGVEALIDRRTSEKNVLTYVLIVPFFFFLSCVRERLHPLSGPFHLSPKILPFLLLSPPPSDRHSTFIHPVMTV